MSRLPNGSASASDRTLACPASLALPRVERSSDDAERGHQIHGFVHDVLEGVAPEKALEKVAPEHRPVCVLLDWSRLGADLELPLESEGAYAVDMRARTARYLGSNIGRRYHEAAAAQGRPLGEHEVPGSLDIAGLQRGRPKRLVVMDLKNGFRDVTPSIVNGQGLFFAAAKFLINDADPLAEPIDEVEFRIAHSRASGAVWDRDRAVFTRLDVDSYLDEYEEALEAAGAARQLVTLGKTPDVAEGDWCRYCAASDSCPAKTRLARAMLPELAEIEGRIEAMTIEDVGRVYEIAHERAKPVLDRVLESLKERIKREGMAPFPDGVHCAKVSAYPEARFSNKLALELLRHLGATEKQIEGCYAQHEVRKVITGNLPKARRRAGKGRAQHEDAGRSGHHQRQDRSIRFRRDIRDSRRRNAGQRPLP